MSQSIKALCVFGMTTVVGTVLAAGVAEVGKPAPEFKLPGTDGKTYELSQFKGEKPVVIAWYPKAKTGG